MHLQDTEIEIIVRTLVNASSTKSPLRTFLMSVAPGAGIDAIAECANVRDDAQAIVRHLDSAHPQALLAILRQYAIVGDIDFIARRYEKALQAPAPEPWRERLLLGRNVLLDRGPLRDLLRSLLDRDRPSVLLVTGPEKSGKSRTADLVQHVATSRKHPYACVRQADTWGAADAVQQILSQLEAEKWEVDPVPSPDSHWYRRQCTRITTAAKASMRRQSAPRCWIVIDQVGASSGSVVELCDHLMQIVAPTVLGLRLILIGYPREATPDALPDGAVEWDRLAHGGVGEIDVRNYLTWLYAEVAGTQLTDEGLTSAVSALLDGMVPESEGFLMRVGRRLEEHTRMAFAGVR
jgi:hypothetical protein